MSLFQLPVTLADLLQLQQGITFTTNQAEATLEVANINAGGTTVFDYAKKLIAGNISTSQVAMADFSLMLGATPSIAELTNLTQVFLPPQIQLASLNNFNPTVFAAEALGKGLASLPGFAAFTALGPTQFAQAVSIATGDNAAAILNFVNNWIAFYTKFPVALQGLTITQASYGAAFGDAVGVALLNPTPLGPNNEPASLPDARFNFVQNEVYNALKDIAENQYVVGVELSSLPPEALLQGEAPSPGSFFTLTISQDTFVGRQGGGTVFNAPLSGVFGGQPTLTNGDSLTAFGLGNVLNATFNGDHTAASVNIVGVQTWNIEQTQDGTIVIRGDAIGGPNIISGLRTVNFNADSNCASLIIGNNLQPVQTTADGFTINVFDAPGHGSDNQRMALGLSVDNCPQSPGVDVDIWAQGFTGHDTINVTANVVGGFPLSNSSFVIPPEILVASNDGDDYDPNWVGYLGEAFSISAGASAGPNGPVGFATWQIASIGAAAIQSLNIIALGGEGSKSATTINLTDDGSNTMLFATSISDSLSTDWQNVKTVNLAGTSGFVTLTGLETNVEEVTFRRDSGFIGEGDLAFDFSAANFAFVFQLFDGGGLLASDTAALTSIVGGAGNSFYDLSSLTPAAAHAGSFDGGHSTAGNSEIAFNNAVFTSGLTVTISHIQILDDVSSLGAITVPIEGGGTAILENGGEAQGGTINMANFAGLQPLNVAYALLAEDLHPNGGVGAPAPFGLPFTVPQFLFTPPASQAALLPPTVTAAQALDYQNGIVPAGFDLLQLLNAEGSTQTVLGAKLSIENGPSSFAVNMQDTGDGFLTEVEPDEAHETHVWNGFDINIFEAAGAPPTIINTANTLVLFVSDDGVTLRGPDLPDDTDGPSVGTAMFVPELSIQNYSTVNIVLPTESVGFGKDTQDYVILGGQDPITAGPGFDIEPVVTVQNATVNFFDNNADNGGSPPGGEDNLVLGFTNFTATLAPVDIGVASVVIDTHPIDFSATINDFGTGSLEIGATNVTNLNAQSTSHLIMDLPGALDDNGAGGITVNGSLLGQNLLQGTSGEVDLDPHGHNPSLTFGAIFDGTVGTLVSTGTDFATVLEAHVQRGGTNGGWGNDVLTGGDGFGSATTSTVGGHDFTTFTPGVSNASVDQSFLNGIHTETGPGNTGDNFFPEGGNDIVNIAAGETGTFTSFQDLVSSSGTVLVGTNQAFANFSTVWVGFYDICNSAGPNAGAENFGAPNSGVGTIYDQAITDLLPSDDAELEEMFVDGYGNSGKDANDPSTTTSSPAVTINGFHFANTFSNPNTMGDTIVFGVQSWATGAGTIDNFASGVPDDDFAGIILGLVGSDGHTTVGHEQKADIVNVGTAGAFVGGSPTDFGTVITDSIATYANAQDLQNNLRDSGGNFLLNLGGLAGHTEVDILVAYKQVTAGGTNVTIADVTLTNTGAGFQNDTEHLNPVVHDLVHITTVLGVTALGDHNVFFMA
jgi:hypothetical protein